MARPELVTDEHLEYLDDLRESGETNMFGAAAYVQGYFDVSKIESCDIHSYWMKTFGDDDR